MQPQRNIHSIFSSSPTRPGQDGRCGYGPRLPLLVISPYARFNYVDHQVTDQSSVIRFIKDNRKLGRIGNGSNERGHRNAGRLVQLQQLRP